MSGGCALLVDLDHDWVELPDILGAWTALEEVERWGAVGAVGEGTITAWAAAAPLVLQLNRS